MYNVQVIERKDKGIEGERKRRGIGRDLYRLTFF